METKFSKYVFRNNKNLNYLHLDHLVNLASPYNFNWINKIVYFDTISHFYQLVMNTSYRLQRVSHTSSANRFKSYVHLIFLNLVHSTFRIISTSTLDFGHNHLPARYFHINSDSFSRYDEIQVCDFRHILFHRLSLFKEDISAFDFLPPSIKILFLFLTFFPVFIRTVISFNCGPRNCNREA